jgi:uncharacterized integral membrane protein
MAEIRLTVEEAAGPLPPVCICCGEPATVTKTKKMAWHPRWVYALILLHVLVFAIVALALTKRATVQTPLCHRHRHYWLLRTHAVTLSFLLLVAFGVGLFLLAASQPPRAGRREEPPEWFLASLGVMVVGWLVFAFAAILLGRTAVRPKQITAVDITLQRVSDRFVDAVLEADSARRERLARWDDEPPLAEPARPADERYRSRDRQGPPDAIQE